MVSKARRSEITKAAWRKRKREGGLGKCAYCGKPVFVGGIRLPSSASSPFYRGRLFHKVCYETTKARRR